ncbi:MAG TPA: gephyrin-like molybdotransferase Glp [Stenotrophomonas sp.]|nr:gephyrin-like molybdotransferase Glp [Stenotrophomonas sp.]
MSEYPSRIGVEQALAILRELAAARRMPLEMLATARADGRVLAADVAALVDLPGFDNSAMDGFALRHADAGGGRLRLAGEQFAGQSGASLGLGECVRITTGAPLPRGADTILIRENAREADGWVTFDAAPALGNRVRRAGEDVRAGDVVLRAGCVLTAARIGLAAAVGQAQLPVHARPTVAVFATGDEIVEPGLPLAPGQIYNANRDLLMARLRELGFTPVAWPTLPDDPARIETMLGDAAAAFDVILTCGGVSAGDKDYLPGLLARLGRIHFWKVRMRPGMPLLCGELDRAVVLGLPGNPVSVLATFTAFAQPLLDALQGREEPPARLFAALDAPWDKRHERLELLRGRLHCDERGQLHVTPHPADASHRLRGAADSDVLLVLAEGARSYAVGEVVEVLRY